MGDPQTPGGGVRSWEGRLFLTPVADGHRGHLPTYPPALTIAVCVLPLGSVLALPLPGGRGAGCARKCRWPWAARLACVEVPVERRRRRIPGGRGQNSVLGDSGAHDGCPAFPGGPPLPRLWAAFCTDVAGLSLAQSLSLRWPLVWSLVPNSCLRWLFKVSFQDLKPQKRGNQFGKQPRTEGLVLKAGARVRLCPPRPSGDAGDAVTERPGGGGRGDAPGTGPVPGERRRAVRASPETACSHAVDADGPLPRIKGIKDV